MSSTQSILPVDEKEVDQEEKQAGDDDSLAEAPVDLNQEREEIVEATGFGD